MTLRIDIIKFKYIRLFDISYNITLYIILKPCNSTSLIFIKELYKFQLFVLIIHCMFLTYTRYNSLKIYGCYCWSLAYSVVLYSIIIRAASRVGKTKDYIFSTNHIYRFLLLQTSYPGFEIQDVRRLQLY